NSRDSEGLNDKPSRDEVSRCSFWLRQTILIVDPIVVVTLGIVALQALKLIERHELSLRENVGGHASWFTSQLLPFSHPDLRALILWAFFSMRSGDARWHCKAECAVPVLYDIS